MKTLLDVIIILLSVLLNSECKQVFTCTRDRVGNLTQIENGSECLYTWISDASIGTFFNNVNRLE